MKVVILGGGFTGLTAALRLLQQGFEVTVIEKEPEVGGLAGGFKKPGWDWTLEKAYHHWFTSDNCALGLAKELNHPVITVRPSTDVYIQNNFLPLDSPISILQFPYLPMIDKLRMGLVTAYLRYIANPDSLSRRKALPWLRKYMGQKSTETIWEPLFQGKFGDFKEEIALSWFWARIKKRTPSLAYPEGGFQVFADKIAQRIEKLGRQIVLKADILELKHKKNYYEILTDKGVFSGDIVLSTLPTPVFTKIAPGLPKSYMDKAKSIPHLSALNLILTLKKPFLKDTYWLNITDKSFPFLVLAEHTNFMSPKNYSNEHILYVGNYLPNDHPYLKMSAQQLLKVYDPYLKKINPNYQLLTPNPYLFPAPFAQPVVTTNYQDLIPKFHSPLPNVYTANMDMVYPWDRGTNYAIEMGEQVAELINHEN